MSTQRRAIELQDERTARQIVIGGRVQGVGFRPFVYRMAARFGLSGRVRNGPGQVVIHVEGDAQAIIDFQRALISTAPPLAEPYLKSTTEAVVEDTHGFRIEASEDVAAADVHLPPDMFCCADCLAEMRDPAERRFGYAFTNCTQCGPRYTIIKALPYDRPSTSMAGFTLCPRCRREYDDPTDRRFHAQPLACPECGPTLTLWPGDAEPIAGEGAFAATLAALRNGEIVAVKGVGGYHLMCDASNDAAVANLRARKHRPHKPLAVMFPQCGVDGLEVVRTHVVLDDAEANAIADPARPIVLVRRRDESRLSAGLAPGLGELGVFLPYSPLHHRLLSAFGAPLVATSGNISGEPVITDNAEAASRLASVADAFLHHDRPIVRPADDSVARIIAGQPRPIRIGRGRAPLELTLPHALAEPTLAVGGHMKGAIALGWDQRVVISPHIGELDSPRSLQVFQQVIADLQTLYRVEAGRIVCDAHPGYASTRWAAEQGLPVTKVQHHVAHASALAAEHPHIERWLVFAWDGIGLGDAGELWGGEAFAGASGAWRRVASIRPFSVTGGDRVGREPWRSAAGLMWETGRQWSPAQDDDGLTAQAWRKDIGTARTSSVGRLFDAAASLALGVDIASFEGQGPMLLESAATRQAEPVALPLTRDEEGIWRSDWEPLLPILTDQHRTTAERAGLFHASIAQALVDQALALAETEKPQAIGLSGGVFQNRLLAEQAIARLTENGIEVHLPQIVPTNDGGLALGQIIEALAADKATPQAVETGNAS